MACGGGGFISGPLLSLLVAGLVRRGTSARVTTTGRESHRCTISWDVEAATARVSFGVETCRTQCTIAGGPQADFGYDVMFRKVFNVMRLESGWLQCHAADKTFELPPPRASPQGGGDAGDNQQQRCWEMYKILVTDTHNEAGTVRHNRQFMADSKFEYGECDSKKECSGADGQPIRCPLEFELPSIVASRAKDQQANIGRAMLNLLGKQTLTSRDRAEVVQLPVPDVMQAVVSYLDGSEHTMKEMEVRNFGIHVVGATPASVNNALAQASVGGEGYTLAAFTAVMAKFRTDDELDDDPVELPAVTPKPPVETASILPTSVEFSALPSSYATPAEIVPLPSAYAPPAELAALPSAYAPPAELAPPPSYAPPTFVTPPAAEFRVHEVAAVPLAPIWEVTRADPIVFVVDLSASMRSAVVLRVTTGRQFILPSRYALVIEEIEGILTGFPGVGFNVIVFNDKPSMLFEKNFVQANSDTVRIAGERLRRMVPTGGTNIEAALALAQSHCTDAKAVYLLTDGMANAGCLEYHCMPMQGYPGQASVVPVHAAYFAPGETSQEAPRARMLLQRLAQASQGSYNEPRWS